MGAKNEKELKELLVKRSLKPVSTLGAQVRRSISDHQTTRSLCGESQAVAVQPLARAAAHRPLSF